MICNHCDLVFKKFFASSVYSQTQRYIHISHIAFACQKENNSILPACLRLAGWLVGWTALSFLLQSLSLSAAPSPLMKGCPWQLFVSFVSLFSLERHFSLLSTFIWENDLKFSSIYTSYVHSQENTRERTSSSTLHHHQYTISLLPPPPPPSMGKCKSCETTVFVNYYASFNISQILQSQLTFFLLSNLLQRFVRNFTIFSP